LLAVATSQLVAKPSHLLPQPPVFLPQGPLPMVKVADVILQISPRHSEVEHELIRAKL
jgi:hypothetical protein